MNDDKAIWYLPGESGQAAGPYAAAAIKECLRSKTYSGATLCWREGMTDWRPLAEVEPFAGELTRQKAAAKKRGVRIVITAVIVACLAAGGVVAYFVVMGPAQVRQGRRDIAAGYYEDAVKTLKAYVNQNRNDMRARYLLAIAQVNEYATTDADGGLGIGILRMGTSLKEAKENLGQVLRTKSGWREDARNELAAAAARIPSAAANALDRTAAIAQLRADLNLADKGELAKELMGRLSSSGRDAGLAVLENDDVVQLILEWAPSLSGQIVERALGTASGSEQELRRILSTLEQWTKRLPAISPAVASQLLTKAVSLYDAGRHAQAKVVLSKALVIDPKAAETEEIALLSIRLMDPDDAKLTRCQYFLKQWPRNPSVADVLMVMVKDAVAVSDRYGSYQRDPARPFLAAGDEAARRLLQDFPTVNRLDVEVYELAKRLEADKQSETAIGLASALLAAVPNSAIKLQINDSVAQWRQKAGKGPSGLDELAKQAETLHPMVISVGGAVRSLRDMPSGAVRVIQVADGCRVDTFNSEEKEILRRWVSDGGILWVNNDVLSLFGIKYASSYGINEECRVVAQQIHPALAGCDTVVVSKGNPAACDLNYQGVRQLLNATGRGFGARQYCCWSLVPYGKGWISDVKTVDTTKGDGAQFWVQFRLWCLGVPIPGAPIYVPPNVPAVPETVKTESPGQTPSPTPPGPGRITDANELQKALAGGAAQKVLWLALSWGDVDPDTRNNLYKWIIDGGVLWVETDISLHWGFTGLHKDSSPSRSGQGQVAQGNRLVEEYSSGGLFGTPTVSYTLDPDGLTLTGLTRDFLSRRVLPLLLETPLRVGEMRLVCGICPLGKGCVALRPMSLNGPAGTDVTPIETKLLLFSRNPVPEYFPDPPSVTNPGSSSRRGGAGPTRQPFNSRGRGAR